MNEQTIFVTGVSGFIGKNVARHFSLKGWKVIGIDNVAFENSPTAYLSKYYQINLPSPQFDALLRSMVPEGIIHCAGRASVPQSIKEPKSDFENGPTLTFSLLNAIRENTPKTKFLLLSSAAVYGNPESLPISEKAAPKPISPYGFHKWQSELICQEFNKIYDIPCAIARVFSAYGPGLKRQVIWDMFHKMKFSQSIKFFGTGMESRDFIHVLDIAMALEQILIEGEMNAAIYNVASGIETPIKELADSIHKLLGTLGQFSFDNQSLSGNPLCWKGNIQKINSLGFNPSISLKEGLQFYTNWFLAEHSLKK